MKKLQHYIFIFFLCSSCLLSCALAQEQQHISKLELGKKKKKTFNSRDSSIVVYIDSLIMKDKSSLQFYGKKEVKLVVKYAEIGKKAYISGIGAQNNASNFQIDMHLAKLGSLYIIASGLDANNGSKTFPNGNGGKVLFEYRSSGIQPQSSNKKAAHYLAIDVSEGGRTATPIADMQRIHSQIAMAAPGLRGLPQGQIYAGSPGEEGKVTIRVKPINNSYSEVPD